jgi:hypothetical protein
MRAIQGKQMIMHRAEQRALALLAHLGRVDPPSAAVLAAARESLRSHIAGEKLSAELTRNPAWHPQAQPDPAQQPAPRRRQDQAPPPRRHWQAGG